MHGKNNDFLSDGLDDLNKYQIYNKSFSPAIMDEIMAVFSRLFNHLNIVATSAYYIGCIVSVPDKTKMDVRKRRKDVQKDGKSTMRRGKVRKRKVERKE